MSDDGGRREFELAVELDPDAYQDDDDDIDDDVDDDDKATASKTTKTTGDDDEDNEKGDANEIETFERALDDVFGYDVNAARDAKWMKDWRRIATNARVRTSSLTHDERRRVFERWKTKRMSDSARERGEKRKHAGEKEMEARRVEREGRALAAREREAMRERGRAEMDARVRLRELSDVEHERAFVVMCAEKVKTYARTYEEAFAREFAYDARSDAGKLRGGERRARELYEEHRASVEKTLKTSFVRLCAKILDRSVARAVAAGAGERGGTVETVFGGALSYANALEKEYELVDDAVFHLVPDDDRKKMWTSVARDVLARHDVVVENDKRPVSVRQESASESASDEE